MLEVGLSKEYIRQGLKAWRRISFPIDFPASVWTKKNFITPTAGSSRPWWRWGSPGRESGVGLQSPASAVYRRRKPGLRTTLLKHSFFVVTSPSVRIQLFSFLGFFD